MSKHGTPYAGYGVVILNPNTNKYVSFSGYLGNIQSVPYCEGKALLRGLQYIEDIRIKHGFEHLNVLAVTDSDITVNILNRYVYSWATVKGSYVSKTGKVVKNEKLYRKIKTRFIDNDCYDVRVIHVNSHKNDPSIIKNRVKLYGINISNKTATVFMNMNDIADRIARKESLYEKTNTDIWPKLIVSKGCNLFEYVD